MNWSSKDVRSYSDVVLVAVEVVVVSMTFVSIVIVIVSWIIIIFQCAEKCRIESSRGQS